MTMVANFEKNLISPGFLLNIRKSHQISYPGSEVPLQRKPSKQSEERETLVTCDEAFRMIGAIKLSHIPLVESGLIGRSDEHRTQTALKRAGCVDNKKNICAV